MCACVSKEHERERGKEKERKEAGGEVRSARIERERERSGKNDACGRPMMRLSILYFVILLLIAHFNCFKCSSIYYVSGG